MIFRSDLGWPYFEKLAQQNITHVQSAIERGKKLALGDSAIQADGADSNLLLLKDQGAPVEPVDHRAQQCFPERAPS